MIVHTFTERSIPMLIHLMDFRNLALMIMVLFLASCKNNSVNPSNDTAQTTIDGKINDWKLGDTLIVVASAGYGFDGEQVIENIIGSSKVTNNGIFSLQLSTPQSRFLHKINNNFTSSDTNALFASCDVKVRDPHTSTDLQLLFNGNVSRNVLDSYYAKVGDYDVSYVYADREARLTGSYDFWSHNFLSADSVHYYYQYDELFHAGWNKIISTIVTRNDHEVFKNVVVKDMNEGNWFMNPNYTQRLKME